MTTEISRLRKSRSANRNIVLGLIVRADTAMKEDYNEETLIGVRAILRTIKDKEILLTGVNGEILNLVEEDKICEETEGAIEFELKAAKGVFRMEDFIQKYGVMNPDNKANVKGENTSPAPTPKFISSKVGVRLPKISIKRFIGDPTTWQQFYETFQATVHQNANLSDVEKFSYLQGFLGGEAEKCIEGIALSKENYKEALHLLEERFGNPQLTIASHMNKLLKLERINGGRSVKELRNLFDQIESHVRSLSTIGVKSEHYGSLLIPVIIERLPDDVKLIISRKLGKVDWKIEEFMRTLKEEITARESCNFMKMYSERDGTSNESCHLTTEALFANTNTLMCAFCKWDHFHDKCTVVTDAYERKEIARKYRLCFK